MYSKSEPSVLSQTAFIKSFCCSICASFWASSNSCFCFFNSNSSSFNLGHFYIFATIVIFIIIYKPRRFRFLIGANVSNTFCQLCCVLRLSSAIFESFESFASTLCYAFFIRGIISSNSCSSSLSSGGVIPLALSCSLIIFLQIYQQLRWNVLSQHVGLQQNFHCSWCLNC